MNTFLSKWLSISFLNLLLVAFLGFILRYKIAFYLTLFNQKYILHSHSHFAFSGWITQSLMVLLIYYLSLKIGEQVFKKYRLLLYANLICSYGMLITFIIQGYGLYSISFSTLSILVSIAFTIYFWKDLNRINKKKVSVLWFKAALAFGIFSSIGAFSLSYLMANKISDQNWYLASIYFYLHFQYNGWFLFAGMGLLSDKLEFLIHERKKLYFIFILFFVACIPAYFLSILWFPFPGSIYFLLIAAVLAQLIAWALMLKIFFKNKVQISKQLSPHGKTLLILSAFAFTIKLLLQSGSIHPALSQLSYGFRPIIIGYLHLVLLGVTSIFILGYIISFKLININKMLIAGTIVFVTGIIINELLLMLQGVAAMSYTAIPYINEVLLGAALILFSGTIIIFFGNLWQTNTIR
jgi:hypothetical protein